MTDAKKLEAIRVCISDLGSMQACVWKAARNYPIAQTLYNRLWAIREIILNERSKL
jgi:hypothetical protein